MPQKIEVDGVGTFEVDDSFFNMTPEQQQTAIGQMAEADKQGITASEDYTGPPPEGDFKPADPTTVKPVAIPPSEVPQSPTNGPQPDLLATITQGATLGLSDEIRGGMAAVRNAVTAPFSDKVDFDPVGAYTKQRDDDRAVLEATKKEHPWLSPALEFGGGLLIPGGVIQKGKGLAALAKSGAKTGAAVGGTAGFGYGEGLEDSLTAIAPGVGLGAAIGATLPVAGAKVADVLSKYNLNRFVKKQASENPFAAYDAEIASDIAGITDRAASSPLDPKGRAKVTAKELNDVEGSYAEPFTDYINNLDISQVEKVRLKAALMQKFTMPLDEADKLRGTPHGDAVADAIVKTQRLRKLTPELPQRGRFPTTLADMGGAVTGYALDGLDGALGGFGASKMAQLALKAMSSKSGEAARVHSAEKLIKQLPKYEALAQKVGPSGARESKAGLQDAFESTVTSKETARAEARAAEEAARKVKEAKVAQAAKDREAGLAARAKAKLAAEEEKFRKSIEPSSSAKAGNFQLMQQLYSADLPAPPASAQAGLNRIMGEVEVPTLKTPPSGATKGMFDLTIMRDGTPNAAAANAKTAAKEAAAAEKAKAKLESQALKETNARVGVENLKDNIVPSGGYRARLHQNTGLKPAEQDAAAFKMLTQGKITQEQFDQFLKDPNKLQIGNAGNAIMDRMNAMADGGELPRDPQWVKPQPVFSEPTANIRNPIAYETTARANQQRVSDTLASVHSMDVPDNIRQVLAEGVTKLGNTSSSADADAIVSAVRQAVGDKYKDQAARLLTPLAAQIK